MIKSFCHYGLGGFGAAEAAARAAAQAHARETWSRFALAISLVGLGRIDAARAAIAEARSIDPRVSLGTFESVAKHMPRALREQVLVALRSAGLEE